MMGRMIRTLAFVATMGTRPGEARWLAEIVCGLASVIVGSFALMLLIGLVLGGFGAHMSHPYRTFGELLWTGYRFGLIFATFTFAIPVLFSLLAQVVPWAHFRYCTDPILLAIQRARVRLLLLAFFPVIPFAAIVCGALMAMTARNPYWVIDASTVPGWIESQVLELVVYVSLASGVGTFVWIVVHGIRRVRVLMEPNEDICQQCQYCIVGLERCPECGLERHAVEEPDVES